ncbi:hypothetical protein HDU92_007462 [Lobulomyces angularis]|nr:hypothetical protein HDU92_007462 [Lobulomyces angularis]
MNKIKENYKFEITNLIGTNLVSSTWILVCRGKILKNYRFFKYFEQKFEIKSQFGGFFIKNDFFTFLDYEHQGKEDFEKKSNIIYASKNNNSKNLDIHNNENILQNNNLKKEDNKINFLNADERNLECVEDRSSSTIFSASENLNITSVKNKNNFEQLSSESLQEESKKKIDLVGVAENFASFSTYKISDENTTVDNENIYYTSGNYNNTLINNKFPQQQRFQRSPLTLNSGSNVLEILDENTIFLKNIPNGTTLQDLQSVFKKIGLIKDIRIKEEKKIAFVEFIDKNSVSNCKGKRVYSENGIVYFPEECRRKVK